MKVLGPLLALLAVMAITAARGDGEAPPAATQTPAVPGDCTGDGSNPNILDVLRLLRHVGDPTVPLSCGNGDCTGDGGDPNVLDVLRLLRHIGDPTVPLSC